MKYYYCKDTTDEYLFMTNGKGYVIREWRKHNWNKDYRLVKDLDPNSKWLYLDCVLNSAFFDVRHLVEITKSELFVKLI